SCIRLQPCSPGMLATGGDHSESGDLGDRGREIASFISRSAGRYATLCGPSWPGNPDFSPFRGHVTSPYNGPARANEATHPPVVCVGLILPFLRVNIA